MDIYTRSAIAIISAQKRIIGPIALEQATRVSGLRVIDSEHVQIQGDAKGVLSELVKKYEEFFGQASVEVCKDAVKEIKPPIGLDELPDNLK